MHPPVPAFHTGVAWRVMIQGVREVYVRHWSGQIVAHASWRNGTLRGTAQGFRRDFSDHTLPVRPEDLFLTQADARAEHAARRRVTHNPTDRRFRLRKAVTA